MAIPAYAVATYLSQSQRSKGPFEGPLERPMLTEVARRKALPGEKNRKLYDERGLFLLVRPSGSKVWRMKYLFAG
ncbi:phage integrase [Novosphingobium sp. Rr 2-17]|nr:phage integrase [Novosphingobium sp. Rr 2-17]